MNQSGMISVIVPVYNVEKYLKRCVDSITGQVYSNLEIILVDDGSPDHSGALCDELAAADPRIRVIHKENGGLSSARNAGMDVATGEYLSFIDSDDWIEPDTYRYLMVLMQRYDAQIACMGNMDVSDRTGERKLALCPKRDEGITAEELVSRMFRWDGIDCAACDKVFRRELFDGIRFPLGKVCEDIAIMYRVVLGAERAAMCSQPFYNYFHHLDSITRAALSDRSFHYSEHTEKILADILAHYPQLEKPARFLRVKSLIYNVMMLDLATKEVRSRYIDIYTSSRSELRRNFAFMVSSGYFSIRELGKNTLMILGVYRSLRNVRNYLRRGSR